MYSRSVLDFLKRYVFFLLGGACLVVVGVIFMLGRSSPAEVIRSGERIVGDESGFYGNEALVNGLYLHSNAPAIGLGTDSGVASGSSSGGVAESGFDYAPMPETSDSTASDSITSDSAYEPEPSYIIIHIVGAVNSPGVFRLREGSRVYDAVNLAGGASDEADLVRINLAAVMQDAMQIIVPAIGEDIDEVFIFADLVGSPAGNATSGGTQAPGTQTGAQNHSDGLININTATSAELQTLSGVGPVLAQNIIDFRETHGNFSSVDELIHVPRIGPATLERLRSSVTVG